MDPRHLVIPGQVVAFSNRDENSTDSGFLRGHGTHVESSAREERLVASVTGVVQRVNKLVSVQSVLSDKVYQPQVGDLVVGRVTAVQAQRWTVELTPAVSASLPLSAVHLGGVQRMRTAQDARDMREFLKVGDLVSAEILKAASSMQVVLQTRSVRYGKLENGCLITVPPQLVARRKNHYLTGVLEKFDVLFGCNGMIWMQRKIAADSGGTTAPNTTGGIELVELQQEQRETHASTPLSNQERRDLARVRNSVSCLRLAHRTITSESVEEVYRASEERGVSVSHMLWPEHVVALTNKK